MKQTNVKTKRKITQYASHPLTTHLRLNRGMTLRGWSVVNLCDVDKTRHVVYHGYYAADVVTKFREQGLYNLLARDIRARIERTEKSKGGLNGK